MHTGIATRRRPADGPALVRRPQPGRLQHGALREVVPGEELHEGRPVPGGHPQRRQQLAVVRRAEALLGVAVPVAAVGRASGKRGVGLPVVLLAVQHGLRVDPWVGVLRPCRLRDLVSADVHGRRGEGREDSVRVIEDGNDGIAEVSEVVRLTHPLCDLLANVCKDVSVDGAVDHNGKAHAAGLGPLDEGLHDWVPSFGLVIDPDSVKPSFLDHVQLRIHCYLVGEAVGAQGAVVVRVPVGGAPVVVRGLAQVSNEPRHEMDDVLGESLRVRCEVERRWSIQVPEARVALFVHGRPDSFWPDPHLASARAVLYADAAKRDAAPHHAGIERCFGIHKVVRRQVVDGAASAASAVFPTIHRRELEERYLGLRQRAGTCLLSARLRGCLRNGRGG
mmetsp:Transcript_76756/g.225360  ORF Transcript_76756/g.225360 Transcript_76756/m.225360 type:complete len:392 (-) Transcript_76756:1009-2184(-)